MSFVSCCLVRPGRVVFLFSLLCSIPSCSSIAPRFPFIVQSVANLMHLMSSFVLCSLFPFSPFQRFRHAIIICLKGTMENSNNNAYGPKIAVRSFFSLHWVGGVLGPSVPSVTLTSAPAANSRTSVSFCSLPSALPST